MLYNIAVQFKDIIIPIINIIFKYLITAVLAIAEDIVVVLYNRSNRMDTEDAFIYLFAIMLVIIVVRRIVR